MGRVEESEEEWWTSSTCEGKVENFNFTVSQWRGLIPAICAMGLGENEGVCAGIVSVPIMLLWKQETWHCLLQFCHIK